MAAAAAVRWAAVAMPMASSEPPIGSVPDGSDDDGKELHNWSSLIGIIIAIVGNALIALALNIQRFAHIRINRDRIRNQERAKAALKAAHARTHSPSGSYGTMGSSDSGSAADSDEEAAPLLHPDQPLVSRYPDDDDDDSGAHMHKQEGSKDHGRATAKVTYLQSPYWWVGQVIMTVGEMGNFLAYGFAPASIVSPLGVVALVANCIIAPLFFGERFRGQDLMGVVVAVMGVVTVVASAKGEETRLDPDDVWKAITQLPFEIYMVVSMVAMAVLVWMSRRYGRRTILIDLGLVGLFGGYTALATKAISSILSASFFGAFAFPLTYTLLLVLLVTAVLQIRYVNRALQRFDSTQVIPVQFVMFTMSVILGSAVLYRDFERTSLEEFIKFAGGCLLTFFGVFLVTNGRPDRHDDDEEEEEEDEHHLLDDDEEGALSDAEGVAETIGLSRQEALVSPAMAAGPVSVSIDGPSSSPPSLSPPKRSTRAGHANGATAATMAWMQAANVDPSQHPRPPISESAPMLSSSAAHLADPLGISNGPQQHAGSDNVVVSATPPFAHAYNHSHSNHLHHANTFPTPGQHDQSPSQRMPPATPRRQSLQRQHTFSPSPLSTTVATVVNDALGQPDTPTGLANGSSLRRIRSTIRASLFLDDERPGWAAEGDAAWVAPALLRAHSHSHSLTIPNSRNQSRSLSQPHSLSNHHSLSPVHASADEDGDADMDHPDDPLLSLPAPPPPPSQSRQLQLNQRPPHPSASSPSSLRDTRARSRSLSDAIGELLGRGVPKRRKGTDEPFVNNDDFDYDDDANGYKDDEPGYFFNAQAQAQARA